MVLLREQSLLDGEFAHRALQDLELADPFGRLDGVVRAVIVVVVVAHFCSSLAGSSQCSETSVSRVSMSNPV